MAADEGLRKLTSILAADVAGDGLIHAAVVKTKATGETCHVDEKNDIERHETAVGGRFRR